MNKRQISPSQEYEAEFGPSEQGDEVLGKEEEVQLQEVKEAKEVASSPKGLSPASPRSRSPANKLNGSK